jgi:hypothetical protein
MSATIAWQVGESGSQSSRNGSKGTLLPEAFPILSAPHDGANVEAVYGGGRVGTLLPQGTERTRDVIWWLLAHRYAIRVDGRICDAVEAATANDKSAPALEIDV